MKAKIKCGRCSKKLSLQIISPDLFECLRPTGWRVFELTCQDIEGQYHIPRRSRSYAVCPKCHGAETKRLGIPEDKVGDPRGIGQVESEPRRTLLM